MHTWDGADSEDPEELEAAEVEVAVFEGEEFAHVWEDDAGGANDAAGGQ